MGVRLHLLAAVLAIWMMPRVAPAEPTGLTVEAALGGGMVRTGGPFSRLDSVTTGGSVAAGVWLSPRTALTGRLVLATYGTTSGDDSSDDRYWFLGPSLQHWLKPWAWISAGAGFALYQEASDGGSFGSSGGWGFDLRIGVAFGVSDQSPHRLGAWLELVPAAYRYIPRARPSPPAEWDVFMSTTLNLGYQFR
jgi:hypothetical protein